MDRSACSNYDVYSDFDLQKHKEHFVNYLEVMVDPDGGVHYAVPSHQEYAIKVACAALGKTRKEISDMTPPEYYFDWLVWLLRQSGYLAVWKDGYQGENVTKAQYAALRELKIAGVYRGLLPTTWKR